MTAKEWDEKPWAAEDVHGFFISEIRHRAYRDRRGETGKLQKGRNPTRTGNIQRF
jgi:hypothetical protein